MTALHAHAPVIDNPVTTVGASDDAAPALVLHGRAQRPRPLVAVTGGHRG